MNIMREIFGLISLVNVFKTKQDLIYNRRFHLIRSRSISLRGLCKHFSRNV